MNCKTCDVPKVGAGHNATINDIIGQVKSAMALHPEVSNGRINLHYARMGEPTWNPNVIPSAYYLKGMMDNLGFKFHPVISTMMPRRNTMLRDFLSDWLEFKNMFNGDAGLQLSINTTAFDKRNDMFSNNAMSLYSISSLMDSILPTTLHGRKIALNFALSEYPIDAKVLRDLFDPKYFMCKITPMHLTTACMENKIQTEHGYTSYHSYEPVETALKEEGFDVLVFVPSKEEDESRITCGNAILADK
jgi:23S rRNA (adenine2503-C2)-methyltransferase